MFCPIRAVFFENLNFCFLKTANILVYGNSAVYIKYCAVCLKIDYVFTIKTPRTLGTLAPLCLLIVKGLTHVFLLCKNEQMVTFSQDITAINSMTTFVPY